MCSKANSSLLKRAISKAKNLAKMSFVEKRDATNSDEFVLKLVSKCNCFGKSECSNFVPATFDDNRYYFSSKLLKNQRETELSDANKIGIIVPIIKNDIKSLLDLLVSIHNQTFSDFEVCLIVSNSGIDDCLIDLCNYVASLDSRFKFNRASSNSFADLVNDASNMISSDWLMVVKEDSLLHPSALFCFLKKANKCDSDVIYSDECIIGDTPNNIIKTIYKPDFAPDDLNAYNYIFNSVIFKKSLLEKVELTNEFLGFEMYDFLLKISEESSSFEHIERVLYCSRNVSEDNFEIMRSATQKHLDRISASAKALPSGVLGFNRIVYEIIGTPLVSIIIPNKDNVDVLKRCVTSIVDKSSWNNYEIIICENGSTDPKTHEYYEEISKNTNVRVIVWDKVFNYSAINNFASKNSEGEYIVLLNNDTEIVSEDWIEELLMHAQRHTVGVVGAMLLYPNGELQHAGIMTRVGINHDHIDRYGDPASEDHFARNYRASNVSAVTGACMMVRRTVWEELNGLDEEFELTYNDTDFCIRAREKGYDVVYNPLAKLIHYECYTRGSADVSDYSKSHERYERELYENRHKNYLLKDPYFNSNFIHNGNFEVYPDFELSRYIEDSASNYSDGIIYISPEMNREALAHFSNVDCAFCLDMPKDDAIYFLDINESFANSILENYDCFSAFHEVALFAKSDDKNKANTIFDISSNKYWCEGFQGFEGDASWTSGKVTVYFRISNPVDMKLVITQKCEMQLDNLENPIIDAYVNGISAGTISINKKNNGRVFELLIKKDLLKEGINTLCLSVPEWSPSEYGSSDTRKLGISVRKIELVRE